jgi:hypothetical protein
MLSNICAEFSATDSGAAAEQSHEYYRQFSDLLMSSLLTFPLLSPPSLEATEALLSAVSPELFDENCWFTEC